MSKISSAALSKFSKYAISKHVVYGIPFAYQNSQISHSAVSNLKLLREIYSRKNSEKDSDKYFSELARYDIHENIKKKDYPYKLNYNNVDVFDNLINILYMISEKHHFSYHPPATIINRTFVQSDNGCRYIFLNSKNLDELENITFHRLIEVDVTKKMSLYREQQTLYKEQQTLYKEQQTFYISQYIKIDSYEMLPCISIIDDIKHNLL
jgi:hypothetical protein